MEEKITFLESEKGSYVVMDENGKNPIAEISGYGLNTKFDMSKINTIEDAEDVCDALSKVFLKALFSQLLEEKNNRG